MLFSFRKNLGEYSSIARKWRVLFSIALSFHCKYTECSFDCLDDIAKCGSYLLKKSKNLFSFSQSIVEQEHHVHNDKGTFSFQVGCLLVSSLNVCRRFLPSLYL